MREWGCDIYNDWLVCAFPEYAWPWRSRVAGGWDTILRGVGGGALLGWRTHRCRHCRSLTASRGIQRGRTQLIRIWQRKAWLCVTLDVKLRLGFYPVSLGIQSTYIEALNLWWGGQSLTVRLAGTQREQTPTDWRRGREPERAVPWDRQQCELTQPA